MRHGARTARPAGAARAAIAASAAALLALVGVVVARESAEPAPPALTRVHDEAGLLSLWREHLDGLAGAWQEDLGIEVAIATIPATPEPLERVAVRWIETHRLGAESPTGGLLVLLEPAGGQARIAVTYSLEGVLPDALLSRIARDQLAPYASYGAVAMAIMDTLVLLRDVVVEGVARGALALDPAFRARPAVRERLAFLSGGGGAQTALPPLPADADWKAPVAGARRARYAPAADPLGSFEAYVRVLEELAGDPTLELFTEGSRVQRARGPVAPYEQRRSAAALRRSGALHVAVDGDRAVVRSDRPARGAHPVLLQRVDGLWRVDLVELWKNVFTDRNGDAMVYNWQSPYRFGLEGMPGAGADYREQAQDDDVSPLPLDRPLAEALAALEAKLDAAPDARTHFDRAELLFRNAHLSQEAMAHYEAAVRLAPGDLEIASAVADRALYFHLYRFAIPRLETLGPAGYERLGWAWRGLRRFDEAERWYQRAVRESPGSLRARRGLASAREGRALF
jgi:tetratricopeptide (TPR) repeat protein